MLHWLFLILEAHKEQETEKVMKQYVIAMANANLKSLVNHMTFQLVAYIILNS